MKKIFIAIFTLCLSLTTFAAMNCRDIDKCNDIQILKTEIANKNTYSWVRMYAYYKMAYIADNSINDSFDKVVKAAQQAGAKCGFKSTVYPVQFIVNVNPLLNKYKKDALKLDPYSSYAFNYYKKQNLTWEQYVDLMIYGKGQVYINFLNKALKMDLKIEKAKKIEKYSMLYEVWYMKLAGKEKAKYTLPVTKIAMKLKSLGYDVNK